MFKHLLNLAVFLVGLLAIAWVGFGYVGSNPLGAAVALLIAICYLAGALELYRYRQATATLQTALADLSDAPPSLATWLERLHPTLRPAVRLRVEGERVALPAPSLTPYLVGLLVLLGMLGTLLGMMATLRGTGLALESASDLQAIRGSLAAPVKGLGFAFGTSIAGVASSAMLGLLSALARRERLRVVQLLDLRIASVLRVHSRAHQRDESFRLLQQQTEAMPVLVERLSAMMQVIEQQQLAASERQFAGQQAFHAQTEAVYARLASSVETSLQASIAESGRAASEAFQPVVASTMAALAQQTTALHDTVLQSVHKQLEGLSRGFTTSADTVAGIWQASLAQHGEANKDLVVHLHASLDTLSERLDARSQVLLDGMSERMDDVAKTVVAGLGAAGSNIVTQLDTTAASLADTWATSLTHQSAANDDLATRNQQAFAAAASSLESHAASLVGAVNQSHVDLQAALHAGDAERLATWTTTLASMTDALKAHWEEANTKAAAHQQEIAATLARTADTIGATTQAHASSTIAEISRLVDAAAEAPRVAAEVVAELRQKLSDSMVRDNAMLDERSRLLSTLDTLLNAVNHASTEQRTAVDALVATSADLLDRVGTRFAEHVEGETGKLTAVGAQLTVGAAEVASLGEVFGGAVQLFASSNDALMERLAQIAAALDTSLTRSDEQLAYYVAQAREVVDLSVLSQRQIIDDMQRLANTRSAGASDA